VVRVGGTLLGGVEQHLVRDWQIGTAAKVTQRPCTEETMLVPLEEQLGQPSERLVGSGPWRGRLEGSSHRSTRVCSELSQESRQQLLELDSIGIHEAGGGIGHGSRWYC